MRQIQRKWIAAEKLLPSNWKREVSDFPIQELQGKYNLWSAERIWLVDPAQ